MISLPIPITKWERVKCYYIQADLNTGEYNNYKFDVDRIRDTDRIADFRRRVNEIYGIDESGFMISRVYDNKMQ